MALGSGLGEQASTPSGSFQADPQTTGRPSQRPEGSSLDTQRAFWRLGWGVGSEKHHWWYYYFFFFPGVGNGLPSVLAQDLLLLKGTVVTHLCREQ